MNTSNRSDKEKLLLLQEHFFYEVQMLQGICLYAQNIKAMPGIGLQFKDNLIQEQFLLHTRNLWEFFYFDKGTRDYARAYQFFKERNAWKKLRPQKTEAIKTFEKRVSVQLAHLTYKRISGKPREKSWDLTTLYRDFMNVVHVFLTNISQDYLDEKLMWLRETGKTSP